MNIFSFVLAKFFKLLITLGTYIKKNNFNYLLLLVQMGSCRYSQYYQYLKMKIHLFHQKMSDFHVKVL